MKSVGKVRAFGGRFGFAYRRLAGMFFRMRYFSDGLLGRLKGSGIRPTVFRQSVHEGMKLYPLFGDMVSDGPRGRLKTFPALQQHLFHAAVFGFLHEIVLPGFA